MIEISISEAQSQLTKILDQVTLIIDKKSHKKRAVLLPIDDYEKLIMQQKKEKVFQRDDSIDKYLGILEGADSIETEDERYKAIIK